MEKKSISFIAAFLLFLPLAFGLAVDFGSNVPSDGSTSENNLLDISLLTSDSGNAHSSFVDFDRSLSLRASMDGSTISDSSSYNNQITTFGTTQTSGKYSSARNFNYGNGDYVEVSDTENLNSPVFTVSTWVNPATLNEYSTIIMKTSGFFWNDGYGIAYYGDQINFFVNDYGDGKVSGSINAGEWSHIVGTFDGSEAKLYINGLLVDTKVINQAYLSNNNSVFIGKGVGDDTYLFDGDIDELTIFNRALTSSEVSSLYNSNQAQYSHSYNVVDGDHTFTGYAVGISGSVSDTRNVFIGSNPINDTNSTNPGNQTNQTVPGNQTNSSQGNTNNSAGLGISFNSPTPNHNSVQNNDEISVAVSSDSMEDHYLMFNFNNSLKFWADMDSLNGDNPNDLSNYNAQVTNINGAMLDSGKFGSALLFDRNNYLDVQASYSDMPQFTNSLWVYPDEDNVDAILIRAGDDAFQILHNYSVRYYDGTGMTTFDAEGVITPNAWNHLAVTSDGSNIRLYVNGELKADYAVAASPQPAITAIGRYKDDAQTYYAGKIDEVMIFDYALDASGISSLYTSQAHDYTKTFSNLPDGVYSFTAYLADVAGNRSSLSRTVYIGNYTIVDNEAPEITINSPVASVFTAYNSINLRFTLNEQGQCVYSLDNGMTNRSMDTNNQFLFTSVENNLSNNEYTLHAFCQDLAGNAGTNSVDFAINFTVENNSTNSTIPGNQTNSTTPGNQTNNTDGNQTVQIPENNTNQSSPILIISPTSGSYVNGSALVHIRLNVSATSCHYKLNGELTTHYDLSSNDSQNFSALGNFSDGNYTMSFYCSVGEEILNNNVSFEVGSYVAPTPAPNTNSGGNNVGGGNNGGGSSSSSSSSGGSVQNVTSSAQFTNAGSNAPNLEFIADNNPNTDNSADEQLEVTESSSPSWITGAAIYLGNTMKNPMSLLFMIVIIGCLALAVYYLIIK